MKKKFLALVLTLAMVLSMAPVGALATNGGEESQTPEDVIYDDTAHSGNATVDGVDSLDKTAKKTGENTYEVKLEVKMHETTSTISQAAATVLVIDVSDSMNDRTCGKKEHTHTNDCYTTEKKCTQAENPDHWVPGLLYHHKDGTTCTYKFPYGYFYEIEPTLKCGREEHTHDSSCYPIAAAKEAANSFVDTYAGTVNGANRYLSIVVFGDKASVKLDWTDVSTSNGKNKAKSAIKGLKVDGGTNLEQGLAKAKSKLEEHTVSSVNFKNVVALTDGAPTFYGERPYGSGSSGSETINNQTAETARNLKAIANLYTVCFGAENKKTYWNGPTVGEFLENSIATDSNHAYNADNADQLNKAFEKISQTITSGLSAGKVHDALPKGVSSSAFGNSTEADWNLSGEGGFTCDKTTNAETGRTDYTYTKTYTVTIDPEEIDPDLLEENDYYPLNGQTTLKVTVNNEEQELNFPIPYGKVKFNTYTVTYKIDGEVYETPEEYTYGTEVTVKSIPTKTGYTFKDWTTSDATISNGKFVMPAKNVELTGSWTAKDDANYTVHYYEANTTTTVAPDKSVNNQTFDSTVTENAIDVAGYTAVAPTSQQVKLDTYDKQIIFYYTANTYTVTWMNGNIQLEKDENVAYNAQPNYGGTMPTKAADSEYTYQFAGWSADPDATTGTADNALPHVISNVIYYAIFTATPQTYTVIFDAQGGNWNENETQKTRTYNGSSVSVTRPEEPTKRGYLFVAWTYENANGSYEEIPNELSLTVNQLMNLPKADTANRKVTLYAKWRLNPEDQITYTIHQHFMKDADNEDGAINYYTTSQVASAGTPISSLIPNELINTSADYNFKGSKYLYEAAKIGTVPYTGQETLQTEKTEIHLYYYLDSLKDADKDGTSTDKDSLTSGDGIPDYKQILIQYQVYQKDNGLVTPEFEVVTVKDDKELTAIHGGSVTKAGTGYTFVTWTGQNATVNETTVDKIVAESTKLNDKKCDPSGDIFEQGKSYTYTAIFLEDKIGDRNDDGTDKGDEIPDRYQVTINYVSSDTSRGSVGTLTKEVLTIYENGKEGKWASKGKVVASGSTATATGSRCYFSRWTNDAKVDTSKAGAILGKQTIENAEGGKTYTFTANFDRSSGGSGGSHKPTVTIPDDVPTGLNGKDHYAYVVGYPDGMVYPQKNITRAEVATIFFRLLTDETREANMTKSNGYNDMKDGAWYTCAVSTLSKMGIIKGYEDGSFKPDASISRAEFAAIAARFDPDGDKTPATFSDVSSHWAKDEISIAANHGWIKGYEDGSFKPDQKITRAETMTLVNRVLKRLPETKDDLHKDMKTWPDNQNESAWFYLAVQEATNSHYQKLKKDGTHETWESMRETRDWAALEK